MNKTNSRSVFFCSNCGAEYPKWMGQCVECREWGTVEEFKTSKKRAGRTGVEKQRSAPLRVVSDKASGKRQSTGIGEVDRVLGGGIVDGAFILLGGNPGIGKSTLGLQIAAGLGKKILYISAEESDEQVALRYERLGLKSASIEISGEPSLDGILNLSENVKPDLILVDSIQTVYSDGVDSPPGAVSQIRECGQTLLQHAKQNHISIIVIGHVTKEGIIAGPRMLEHMVDTVLYLEGDDRYDHRILRSTKNRFGASHEVGIFSMESKGLVAVKNPSELFISERTDHVPGNVIFASIEGSRPILVEVQALVSPANFGNPQRNVTGLEIRRLSMLLAVLEKRLRIPLGNRDVFLNLVGGLRINDPGADLAVISAVASSVYDQAVPESTVVVGEVGLSGEVRSISKLEKRIKESQALGFSQVIAPQTSVSRLKTPEKIKLTGVRNVSEAFDALFTI